MKCPSVGLGDLYLTLYVRVIGMVKRVNVVFDDKEFEKLKDMKGDKSWHDFMMRLAKTEGGGDEL